MGKIAEWMYGKWPMFGELRIRHFAEKAGIRSEMLQERFHKEQANDQVAYLTMQLESLKNKIVERARVEPILKAKSTAEARRMAEQAFEVQLEEQANGI